MKSIRFFFVYLVLLFSCCTIKVQAQDDQGISYCYATYYIVIACAGKAYTPLQQQMFSLSRQLPMDIDTMGRTYDKVKKLIALPVNADDDIYAGEYYPRRYPSVFLSLEYLGYYNGHAGDEKTIALVAGIYANKKDAEKALIILRKRAPEAFSLKAKVYVGCMH